MRWPAFAGETVPVNAIGVAVVRSPVGWSSETVAAMRTGWSWCVRVTRADAAAGSASASAAATAMSMAMRGRKRSSSAGMGGG